MYFGKDFWMIPYYDKTGVDVRGKLKEMGFKIGRLYNDILCMVNPPAGWKAEQADREKPVIVPQAYPSTSVEWTDGYILFDQEGNPRIQATHYHSDEEDLEDEDTGWLVFV
ncbi:hypothetical protein A3K34_04615 [candidate division WWE3 bacterium RIFOXYC1_FULL_40_10]|uniref:Uncharacterized protein n=1 Tax=candidate division WWE3 bacterium RIFOXYA2_FULL_46_9 TaxID=1802636 RepID=A0A1F4W139_UNCKA|nr:MAG: hypothetical protein A3K58_04615 [candidate division WWE3 bacterium RIFOXYB1_FULL_40_22]OGC62124.1 MAG: hypothetical protein A3K37_04615 [candidate division WWE3 bacterium RIFOXYA1_FULL_40_11]OGC63137.1 MAG: hypothetical protein A2264_00360 [candidate division WWE3 bacterium RIFOXYA2_FULL_46_9]OGC64933.1 MAG: hypothetical protein A2326_02750 [candidate division WWE3 bacterium RIFOXYB2_FULL_41_6]OGC66507.1 MAG: hypothetical protein A3K34_04615 [candidate division WWE3 bacterium RIFOXYC1_